MSHFTDNLLDAYRDSLPSFGFLLAAWLHETARAKLDRSIPRLPVTLPFAREACERNYATLAACVPLAGPTGYFLWLWFRLAGTLFDRHSPRNIWLLLLVGLLLVSIPGYPLYRRLFGYVRSVTHHLEVSASEVYVCLHTFHWISLARLERCEDRFAGARITRVELGRAHGEASVLHESSGRRYMVPPRLLRSDADVVAFGAAIEMAFPHVEVACSKRLRETLAFHAWHPREDGPFVLKWPDASRSSSPASRAMPDHAGVASASTADRPVAGGPSASTLVSPAPNGASQARTTGTVDTTTTNRKKSW